jgi:SAM-dependent methyltransferase
VIHSISGVQPARVVQEERRLADAYARRGVTGAARDLAAHDFILRQREHRVVRLLAEEGFDSLTDARILEVGCGDGQWLRDFVRWGARARNLIGIDRLDDRLRIARRLGPAGATIALASAAQLPVADGRFDIAVQSTVFSSVLDPEVRLYIAREMRRVVRPGGLIVWYDLRVNNPDNPDVARIGRQEILRLFEGCSVRLESITLAPPLCRRLIPVSEALCRFAEGLSALRTHYLGAIRTPTNAGACVAH